MKIEFSHMPEVGVSYGVAEIDGKLYMSAAFTNAIAGDIFNKKRAREIIHGRITRAWEGLRRYFGKFESPKVVRYTSSKTPRQVVKDMRSMFKPDGEVDHSQFEVPVPIGNGLYMNARIYRTPHERIDVGSSVWENLVDAFTKSAQS